MKYRVPGVFAGDMESERNLGSRVRPIKRKTIRINVIFTKDKMLCTQNKHYLHLGTSLPACSCEEPLFPLESEWWLTVPANLHTQRIGSWQSFCRPKKRVEKH
jgi:hypothetical protein